MKRSLQVTVALLSLLPLSFGLIGLFGGVSRFLPVSLLLSDLDSQYRFLSAWYLALFAIAWWIIPNIERQTAIFRIVCIFIFAGGLGRLAAWSYSGAPSTRFQFVLVAELLFPILILWQNKLAKRSRVEAT